jgi:hypothetical protein
VAHCVQLAALVKAEYRPAEQSMQRSSKLLELLDSYVPGMHCTLTSQNGWPLLSWYLLAGQAVHAWALVVSEYLSAGHSWHLVSSRLLLSDSNCPGMQSTMGSQNRLPVPFEYLPSGHGVLLPPMQKEFAGQEVLLNVHSPVVLAVYTSPGIKGVATLHPPAEQSVPAGHLPLHSLVFLPVSDP